MATEFISQIHVARERLVIFNVLYEMFNFEAKVFLI